MLNAVQHDKYGENKSANKSGEKQYVKNGHEACRCDRDLPLRVSCPGTF
jgi:hypothetical protein